MGVNFTPPTSLEVSPVEGVIQPITPICSKDDVGVHNIQLAGSTVSCIGGVLLGESAVANGPYAQCAALRCWDAAQELMSRAWGRCKQHEMCDPGSVAVGLLTDEKYLRKVWHSLKTNML